MSVVTEYTSEAAVAKLRKQKRSSTILSITIALLVVVLLSLILFLFTIPGFFVANKTIVTYSARSVDEQELKRPEVTTQVQRKPSAPSLSSTRVLVSSSVSSVSIPVPEFDVAEPSIEFGSGDDFGDGLFDEGGVDGTAGGTSFFGQTASANRVCYVIDYSKSMKNQGREDLMRKELVKSLRGLPTGTKYQMIFFAGPAWVAGSDVSDRHAQKNSVITGKDGKEYKWTSPARNAHDWKPDGERQVPRWIDATKPGLSKSRSLVKKTKLVFGTQWKDPLEMALEMNPPPQVIFFMTDGSAGSETARVAAKIARKAKLLGTRINCVAMMEPRAFKPMDEMAKVTGGSFTKVLAKGEVVKVR